MSPHSSDPSSVPRRGNRPGIGFQQASSGRIEGSGLNRMKVHFFQFESGGTQSFAIIRRKCQSSQRNSRDCCSSSQFWKEHVSLTKSRSARVSTKDPVR